MAVVQQRCAALLAPAARRRRRTPRSELLRVGPSTAGSTGVCRDSAEREYATGVLCPAAPLGCPVADGARGADPGLDRDLRRGTHPLGRGSITGRGRLVRTQR